MDAPQRSQYQPPVMPQPIMPQPANKSWVIPLVVVLALAGGYFTFARYQSMWPFSSQLAVESPTPTVSPSSSPSISQSPTADWKTYTNTKYGFEFKYPVNLFTEENLNPREYIIESAPGDEEKLIDLINLAGPRGRLGITALPERQKNNQSCYNSESVVIGDILGCRYASGHENCSTDISVTAKSLNVSFSTCISNIYPTKAVHNPLNQDSGLIDQILSTFKFTVQ